MTILTKSDMQSKEFSGGEKNSTTKKSTTSVSSWKKKFIRDFTKKEFIPIKGLFFLIYGANMALIPFLTLQARSLGITEEEVGLIYSFIPIAALLAPALSGMLADHIGNFKILLSIVTALSGLCGLLFLLVPEGRVTYSLPDDLPFEVSCFQEGSTLQLKIPYKCDYIETTEEIDLHIQQCSLICANETFDVKSSINVGMESNLRCGNSTNCIGNESYIQIELQEPSNMTDFQIYIYESVPTNTNITLDILRENHDPMWLTYSSSEMICPNFEKPSDFEGSLAGCYTSCAAITSREKICFNNESVVELNPELTFYSHLLIRLLKEFTLATSMPLLDGAAVTILQEHKGDFGFQRMYCNVGMMIMTPISGTLIDYFSLTSGTENYKPAMYMYCALKLIAALIIMFLSLDIKEASNKVISEFSKMILNAEIIAFLMATFLAGIFYGYLETFMFWLLEDLGADKQLMGVTVTVGSVFGIPLLLVSTFIIKQFGYVKTICFGFAVYIIRMLGYTVISNPWWAMPFEALECITVSLMVVTFVSYSSVLSTPNTVVTLQGIHGGLYNGVGRGAGSLMGGYMIQNIGIFATFRVMAAVSGAAGLLYFSMIFLIHSSRRKIADKKAQADVENRIIVEKQKVENGNFTNMGKYEENESKLQVIFNSEMQNNNSFTREVDKL